MDAERFDRIVRVVSQIGSRRRALRQLGGIAAGVAAFTSAGPQEAVAARCRPGKKKCRGKCIPKSRCCPTKSRCCRTADCRKGQLCAKGRCVTGLGTCAIGADTCANIGSPFCEDVTGQHTCICLRRLQGGTRCGVYGNASTCDQCTTDTDCLKLGFPPGSSCTQDFGIDCPLCQNDTQGTCIIPCGRPDPT